MERNKMDQIDFVAKIFFILTQNEPIENRLKAAMDVVRAFFLLDIAAILFIPENNHDLQVIGSGDKEDFIDEYKREYFYLDQYHGFPDNKVVVFHPAVDDSNPSTEAFRSFCAGTVGINAVAGADFRLNQNIEVRLRFTRAHARSEFKASEIKILEKIVPIIRRAIEQAAQAQYHSLFDFSAQKILSRFRIGIVIVNRELEVLDKSALADKLLENSCAFNCNKGRLVAKSRDIQQKLERMIQDLNEHDDVFYRTMNIQSNRGREEYTLAITKENTSPRGSLFTENRFTIFIFSSLEDEFDMGILVTLWRISPAEQRVLSAVLRFDNVKKVALELNISPNTAKAQLKSVYRKLGIESKTMLIKRLNSVKNMAALLS